MEGFWKAVGFLVALVAFGVAAAGGLYAIHYVWTKFIALDDQTAVVIATVSSVALVCAWIIAAAVRSAGSHRAVQVSARNRVATYRRFTDFWAERLYCDSDSGTVVGRELEAQLQDLSVALAMYGSAAVVRSHASVRALWRNDACRDGSAKGEFLKGLIAIRRDLGIGERGVQTRDLEALLTRGGAPSVETDFGQSDRDSAASQAA